ncbi:hypothetical protein [Streptomyces sp. NPDC058045]|uniref:hypothetical protein n=1 Tax=Streptomyces sp. NPDC058045 TaxID=3346311 RepID=UPI0036E1178B
MHKRATPRRRRPVDPAESGRRPRRAGAAAAAVTVLALAASGCVTVHGERERVPSATKGEAARALTAFTTAYNKADQAYDPKLDAGRVAGPLGAINQAGLRAKHTNHPDGNPDHVDLKLTGARYTIPRTAGWPKFFVAEAHPDTGRDGDAQRDVSWLLAFTRSGPDAEWRATYLSVLAKAKVPRFRTGKDGLAEAVPADSGELAVAPGKLSRAYTGYLADGGDGFAPGPGTSQWREQREKNASRPGKATQYLDAPLGDGGYAPLALRTEDGGALVFFSSRHYEKQTAARGLDLTVDKDVRALMKGEPKQSLTMERIAGQAALTPRRGADPAAVRLLSRLQGVVSAKGE